MKYATPDPEAMPETCPECGGVTHRDDYVDSYFCIKCDIWTEAICCSEGRCPYCSRRSEKPSLPLKEDNS